MAKEQYRKLVFTGELQSSPGGLLQQAEEQDVYNS